MEEKTVSTEKIKVCLLTCSLAILVVQHIVGLFAETIEVSYIPLMITFFTNFIATMDDEKTKAIKWVSLFGFIIMSLSAMVIYTLNQNKIVIPQNADIVYKKILFAIIATIAFVLCILYIKRICELN